MLSTLQRTKEAPKDMNIPAAPEQNGKLTMLLILVSVAALALSAYNFIRPAGTKKIGYVRSGEIIYKYIGMKEAQNAFSANMQLMQANLDTLHSEYNAALGSFNRDFASLSPAEREDRKRFLGQQQYNIEQYSQSLEAKSREEEQKMTQGVLNQINSFVEDYGRRNGFDIILGTTMSGSVLYGDDGLDITQQVLKQLNDTYRKKSK